MAARSFVSLIDSICPNDAIISTDKTWAGTLFSLISNKELKRIRKLHCDQLTAQYVNDWIFASSSFAANFPASLSWHRRSPPTGYSRQIIMIKYLLNNNLIRFFRSVGMKGESRSNNLIRGERAKCYFVRIIPLLASQQFALWERIHRSRKRARRVRFAVAETRKVFLSGEAEQSRSREHQPRDKHKVFWIQQNLHA